MLWGLGLLLITLIHSCSNGEWSDARDLFQSRYGVSPPAFSLAGRSIIGRVTLEDGRPAAFARIYVNESQVYTTSNDKGGFLVSGIPAEPVTLYAVSSQGYGIMRSIEDARSSLIEIPDLKLEKLRAISGRIASDTVPISDVRVTLEGTPFSTQSGSDGQYFIEAPSGTYRLKVQHFLYASLQEPNLVVNSAIQKDFQLVPLDPPGVSITVANASDFVVRGLEAEVRLQPNTTMRYQKIMRLDAGNVGIAEESNKWQAFRDRVTLRFEKPGPALVLFQFMDQFGRVTEIMPLNFYCTLHDASWRYLRGRIAGNILIRAGEKVAFLPTLSYDGNPGSTSVPNFNRTMIEGELQVEPGAVLEGALFVSGKTSIRGSADRPVVWDTRGELSFSDGVSISASRIHISHLHFQGASFSLSDTRPSEKPSWTIVSSVFKNVWMEMNLVREAGSQLQFIQNRMESSSLTHANPNIPLVPGNPAHPPMEPLSKLLFEGNAFESSYLYVSLYGDGHAPAERIYLHRNNFLEPRLGSFYLSMLADELEQPKSFPFLMGTNYFARPGHIVKEQDIWQNSLGVVSSSELP